VRFKPVHHLPWTAEVFRIAIGYISSKDFLDEHHSFHEIEAVHRFGNHGDILALGWRKQAIALSENLPTGEGSWGYRLLVVDDPDGNQLFFNYPNETASGKTVRGEA